MSTLTATSFPSECQSDIISSMPRTTSDGVKKMATVSARVEQADADTLKALCEAFGNGKPFKPTPSQLIAAAVKDYILKHSPMLSPSKPPARRRK